MSSSVSGCVSAGVRTVNTLAAGGGCKRFSRHVAQGQASRRFAHAVRAGGAVAPVDPQAAVRDQARVLSVVSSSREIPKSVSVANVGEAIRLEPRLWLTDRGQRRAVDLFRCVVVQQADPDEPRRLKAQRLGQRQGVKVAVPDKDALLPQPLGHFRRGQPGVATPNVGTRSSNRSAAVIPQTRILPAAAPGRPASALPIGSRSALILANAATSACRRETPARRRVPGRPGTQSRPASRRSLRDFACRSSSDRELRPTRAELCTPAS